MDLRTHKGEIIPYEALKKQLLSEFNNLRKEIIESTSALEGDYVYWNEVEKPSLLEKITAMENTVNNQTII